MSNFPYSYFHCPCGDGINNESSLGQDINVEDARNTEDKPFNPHDARSNFSLYPVEHLMWCESCHEIRCPRCVVEEIVCWYCPGCGFEVAGSMVKSEGNRCTRNCFNCPCCTANLFVTSVDGEGAAAPWILECQHCNWTSLDIGITFDKPNNIHGQLAKLLGKARSKVSLILDRTSSEAEPVEPTPTSRTDPDTRFATLLAFYKSELGRDNNNHDNPFASFSGGNADYNSPSSFARIMSLYTNTGSLVKKTPGKPAPMRSAADASDGLIPLARDTDTTAISRVRSTGLSETTNSEQRNAQPHNPRFQSDLLPQATLLCTKRSRRCRACRHILVKPEAKVSNTRYKIKLLALNHMPSMTLKALSPLETSLSHLPPNKPLQFLLTLRNPLFESVKVSLATPAQTPGPIAHSVTILCPSFTLGANADIWDEALGTSVGGSSDAQQRRRSTFQPTAASSADESKVAEAGKIWERGRNWTTVVLEVICRTSNGMASNGMATNPLSTNTFATPISTPSTPSTPDEHEDDHVLQIPLFVRLEYEQTVNEGAGLLDTAASTTAAIATVAGTSGRAGDGAATTTPADTDKKVMRELAYWAVLGVGMVDRPRTAT